MNKKQVKKEPQDGFSRTFKLYFKLFLVIKNEFEILSEVRDDFEELIIKALNKNKSINLIQMDSSNLVSNSNSSAGIFGSVAISEIDISMSYEITR